MSRPGARLVSPGGTTSPKKLWRVPRRPRPLPSKWTCAKAVASLCLSGEVVLTVGLVDCSRSPDCSLLRRQPCSERGSISNACGDCLPGTWGGPGPLNTACLSAQSCAAVYPGEDTCNFVPDDGMAVPFIFPFGRCVCDVGDGRLWPTAPGRCAKVSLHLERGLGQYEVSQCSSRTCEPGSCTPLALWTPALAQTMENISLPCQTSGADAVQLLDDCSLITSRLTPSALCGHSGFTATSTIFDALGDTPVDCELGPSCPASVLDTTRLAQSCCFGTLWSHKLDTNGQDVGEPAPGFCQMVWEAAKNGSNASAKPSECTVKTSGPGWTGCACLDDRGFLQEGKTCSVSCEMPGCDLPPDGIRPVPSSWMSSEVFPDLVLDHATLASWARPRALTLHGLLMLQVCIFVMATNV
mmetsp:Transcript_43744/g.81623  ORF Transcript_43744/g.81623 Transcript_43744/m.81623 type:complete len:411 (+) Transcript_43744:38-1270(+)